MSHISIIVGIIYFLFFRRKFGAVFIYFSRNGIKFAFAVSLVATLGSLFYSEIAGYAPCKLCWFQRIFMYPEVALLGFAAIKKDFKNILNYALSLSVIGFFISLYHNYTYYGGALSGSCGISGLCAKRYVFSFGYISIPLMALTGFFLITVFLFLRKKYEKTTKSALLLKDCMQGNDRDLS